MVEESTNPLNRPTIRHQEHRHISEVIDSKALFFHRRDIHRDGGVGEPMEPTAIQLFMSNVETIPGKAIVQSLGLVTGSTVRAKHLGKDIFAGLKNIVGGELKAYTELLNESRNEALQRMMMQAHSMGANGIVNVRFATSNVAAGASELFCYGTAVVVQ